MESPRQNVSEPIPIDLIIEIFSSLSAKSIARCHCVSKLWSSILVCPDFTELFLTKSSSRPQLLFICRKICRTKCELFFYSTPQPQYIDENSSPLAAIFHMKMKNSAIENFGPTRGLIFLRNGLRLKGNLNTGTTTICNPSTGQSLPLPKVQTRGFEIISYYGYDPVEKYFKVLSMKISSAIGKHGVVSEEHQVLTLGGSGGWRKIEYFIPQYPIGKGVCIDGVMYYPACTNSFLMVYMIVSFDVRSEKFTSIQAMENYFKVVYNQFMFNYNGKLGVLAAQGSVYVNGKTWGFELCVLGNVEKSEWSEHTYVPSPSYEEVAGETFSRCVGVTQANEIVLSPYFLKSTRPFYIIYYNIETNTFVRVEIKGMEPWEGSFCYTFQDHVENVKLMQMV